jgi:predicted RecA/RadA family phage recombinase
MKNFIQQGHNLTLTAPRELSSGDGFQVGSLFAVAAHDAANGAEVEGATVGVYALPKATGGALAQGAKVYWDNSAFKCTATVGSNILIGYAVLTAAADATVVRVRLAP